MQFLPVPQEVCVGDGSSVQVTAKLRAAVAKALETRESAAPVRLKIEPAEIEDLPGLPPTCVGQAYVLDATAKTITITAGGAAGLFYGLQTLVQLVDQTQDGTSLPAVSIVEDQVTDKNTATPAIPFTVLDVETNVSLLSVQATSSDLTVVDSTGVALSGADSDRAVTLTPVTDAVGITTITLKVSDGTDTTERSFTLTVRDVAGSSSSASGPVSGSSSVDVVSSSAGVSSSAEPPSSSLEVSSSQETSSSGVSVSSSSETASSSVEVSSSQEASSGVPVSSSSETASSSVEASSSQGASSSGETLSSSAEPPSSSVGVSSSQEASSSGEPVSSSSETASSSVGVSSSQEVSSSGVATSVEGSSSTTSSGVGPASSSGLLSSSQGALSGGSSGVATSDDDGADAGGSGCGCVASEQGPVWGWLLLGLTLLGAGWRRRR